MGKRVAHFLASEDVILSLNSLKMIRMRRSSILSILSRFNSFFVSFIRLGDLFFVALGVAVSFRDFLGLLCCVSGTSFGTISSSAFFGCGKHGGGDSSPSSGKWLTVECY